MHTYNHFNQVIDFFHKVCALWKSVILKIIMKTNCSIQTFFVQVGPHFWQIWWSFDYPYSVQNIYIPTYVLRSRENLNPSKLRQSIQIFYHSSHSSQRFSAVFHYYHGHVFICRKYKET